ncbi:S-4TM family putative pore-forming effector [[Mycobacterium] crassicus]|uniref:S-4TM family putative pore-forming effector n=1 Tax=[Mycobacterium] crassicus TaxID=2872309 RepID=A0ABU5XMY4_9MYCO|nr:S-4TM family putative pore-forming effector [Mycolicibacter sp. MYC098]MEB3023566.1 S-4TM family putative pore-forming effector [Mycolicibacter sp. MYC098]
MHSHTTPAISLAQNTQQSQRLIAAQARLYSDVKRDSALRLAVIAAVAVSLSWVSINNDSTTAVGTVGGLAALVLQALVTWRERRKVSLASAIQEQFDTEVYQLPWNSVVVRHRPNGQDIARAAARYKGDRTRDWYPDTGRVVRPLDILICQQSNVGWGIPVHRIWSWTLAGAAIAGVLVLGLVWKAASLSPSGGLDAIVVPFLSVMWEVFEHVRTNLASARAKDEIQQLMLDDWNTATTGGQLPTVERCRLFQDQIVGIRRTNAHVPDWFDRALRTKNERAMRTTSHDMVAAAKRAGLT